MTANIREAFFMACRNKAAVDRLHQRIDKLATSFLKRLDAIDGKVAILHAETISAAGWVQLQTELGAIGEEFKRLKERQDELEARLGEIRRS